MSIATEITFEHEGQTKEIPLHELRPDRIVIASIVTSWIFALQ